jgi:hypothetical protein
MPSDPELSQNEGNDYSQLILAMITAGFDDDQMSRFEPMRGSVLSAMQSGNAEQIVQAYTAIREILALDSRTGLEEAPASGLGTASNTTPPHSAPSTSKTAAPAQNASNASGIDKQFQRPPPPSSDSQGHPSADLELPRY